MTSFTASLIHQDTHTFLQNDAAVVFLLYTKHQKNEP